MLHMFLKNLWLSIRLLLLISYKRERGRVPFLRFILNVPMYIEGLYIV